MVAPPCLKKGIYHLSPNFSLEIWTISPQTSRPQSSSTPRGMPTCPWPVCRSSKWQLPSCCQVFIGLPVKSIPPIIHKMSKVLENCCQDLQVTTSQEDLSKYSGLYHPNKHETTNKGKLFLLKQYTKYSKILLSKPFGRFLRQISCIPSLWKCLDVSCPLGQFSWFVREKPKFFIWKGKSWGD